VNSSMMYLMHCKNLCKFYNVPPPSTRKKCTLIFYFLIAMWLLDVVNKENFTWVLENISYKRINTTSVFLIKRGSCSLFHTIMPISVNLISVFFLVLLLLFLTFDYFSSSTFCLSPRTSKIMPNHLIILLICQYSFNASANGISSIYSLK
jgi:hypothetical protein